MTIKIRSALLPSYIHLPKNSTIYYFLGFEDGLNNLFRSHGFTYRKIPKVTPGLTFDIGKCKYFQSWIFKHLYYYQCISVLFDTSQEDGLPKWKCIQMSTISPLLL